MCNRGLWNPWLQQLCAEGTPCVAVDLEPVFGSIDDYLPCIDAAVRALEEATGQPPVAVAHSMGGLALRRWWVEPGHEARIAHAITIGTPHAGTWLARFAISPNARQMREGSAWLRELRARERPDLGARMTCFWSPCDHIVFPARTAIYPGSDTRRLDAVAHVDMADHAEPWAVLRQRLPGSRQHAAPHLVELDRSRTARWKLPSPKPSSPLRWMISKKIGPMTGSS
ncbi:MAG: alpha/beta fold hydrolase [Comamonadaceae bacterium]|nr:alpha/beta fold hydrolase [Comamonadaceae bacterium]